MKGFFYNLGARLILFMLQNLENKIKELKKLETELEANRIQKEELNKVRNWFPSPRFRDTFDNI